MGDRDKARDRHRERDRDIDRDRKRDGDDRDRERERDRDRERERKDRERSKRSHTPDRIRSSRHTRSRTRSPDRHRSRSRSTDRHRRSRHQHRTPSPDLPRKRRKHGDEDRSAAVVSDFVDEIVREQQQKNHKDAADGVGGEDHMEMDSGELEMMKMLGIPVGFDSTKGKPVAGNDVSGIRAVTKRQPRQYMNRRGGFNRPLPAETNR